uniref:Ribonuclease E n=1 Tax=Pyropia perforata TaxID=182771 RepID=A0A023HR51_PYRPE|nr:ribonuclease E [Neoporphyra perforata]AGQ17049.1 ribonuclease E [Neoporphyra perforata]AHB34989.1 ribonuclease E [Neoporphyra perforata]AHB35198.1 ribonuclease E [Neoporphyra perforata]AIA19360.1 ribonuclease E [Neoporphyra perforata]AIA19569.1 ribonuclease E [Neoporphyra perforata]
MTNTIVISCLHNMAAILYCGQIQKLVVANAHYQVSDIYLGCVDKIFSGINAAFIDLGKNEYSGFIHISDTGPLKKKYYVHSITNILTIRQKILVQITKEPTLNKGPRLTANITLSGRYVVLMPFSQAIFISRKIYDEDERHYLKALAILIKPATMGLLFRPSAVGIDEEIILSELKNLKEQWNFIQKSAINTYSPVLLYKDEDIIKKVIRDFYSNNINNIVIDSNLGLKQLSYYIQTWHCNSSNITPSIKLYSNNQCILDAFGINQAISRALIPKVDLILGGYMFIETLEAFTIIDVNSGSFNNSTSARETVLKTNCSAATEIAYQLQIRNIAGVIIIDFIDMESQRDQLQLLEHFNKELALDDAKPQIVQLSELGLVELTRRRQGKSLYELISNDSNYIHFFMQLESIRSLRKIDYKKPVFHIPNKSWLPPEINIINKVFFKKSNLYKLANFYLTRNLYIISSNFTYKQNYVLSTRSKFIYFQDYNRILPCTSYDYLFRSLADCN